MISHLDSLGIAIFPSRPFTSNMAASTAFLLPQKIENVIRDNVLLFPLKRTTTKRIQRRNFLWVGTTIITTGI